MLTSRDVQVGESSDVCLERVSNSRKIYTERKDCLRLKEELKEILKEDFPEYWNVLACFLHGQCSKQSFDDAWPRYLKTVEAKLLHNELIRSILYNAHFALTPPPNVTITGPEYPPHVKKPMPSTTQVHNSSFMTFTASDLRHLPSLNQLQKRIGILLDAKKMEVDSKAIGLVFRYLKRYVQMLLEGSVELLSVRGQRERKDLVITATHVMHVLETHSELAAPMSPTVMTKYSNAMP